MFYEHEYNNIDINRLNSSLDIKRRIMKEYKVIKEFGCAQKGDVLKENEEGLFELNVECDCNDCYSSRSICVSSDVANTLVLAGYLDEVEEVIEDKCGCCDKLESISEYIDTLLEQYENDHNALIEQYNEGDVPQCVKVEADTVYFNLCKVLNHLKAMINE